MDDTPNKGSLKGRGHDIMRGSSSEDSESSGTPSGSGWLPRGEEENDDEALYFENDDALLNWMEADPEAYQPDIEPPPQPAPSDELNVLYDDPDFDAIFGAAAATTDDEQEATIAAKEQIEEAEFLPDTPTLLLDRNEQGLEEIFKESEPAFDELFGDVPQASETLAVSRLPYRSQLEDLPLPQTDELYSEDLTPEEEEVTWQGSDPRFNQLQPVETNLPDTGNLTSPLPSFPVEATRPGEDEEYFDLEELEPAVPMQAATGMALGTPETEFADESTIVDDFGTEPAPRADRRSPEVAPEDDWMVAPPPDLGEEELEEQEYYPEEVAAYAQEIIDQPFSVASPPDLGEEELEEQEYYPEEIESYAEETLPNEPAIPLPEEPLEGIPMSEMQGSTELALDDFEMDQEESWAASSPELGEEVEYYPEETEYYAEETIPSAPTIPWREEQLKGISMSDVQGSTELALDDFEMEPEDAPFIANFEPAAPILSEPQEPQDSEAADFIAMLEEEAAQDASSQPLDVTVPSVPSGSEEPFGIFVGGDEVPEYPELGNAVQQPPDHWNTEAQPLAEEHPTQPVDLRDARFSRSRIDYLNPTEPESLEPGALPMDVYEVEDYPMEAFDGVWEASELGGGNEDVDLEPTRGTSLAMATANEASSDPFGEAQPRRPAREIFPTMPENTPDRELLGLFVDDNRLRELFEQIEALQEEVVENVRGERRDTDIYQEELLQASNLLLSSRDNYDEARAIAYRVRADLNRDRRVTQDIERFRPLITNIYIGASILLLVLALLGQLFISVAESVGVSWLGQGYYPALFGAVGALWFGYRTLIRHTTVERDFDPTHVNWYIINPLMGLLSGFLVYLFALSIAITSISDASYEISGSSPFIYIVAVAVGFNQNVVVNLLDSARQRLAPDGDE